MKSFYARGLDSEMFIQELSEPESDQLVDTYDLSKCAKNLIDRIRVVLGVHSRVWIPPVHSMQEATKHTDTKPANILEYSTEYNPFAKRTQNFSFLNSSA